MIVTKRELEMLKELRMVLRLYKMNTITFQQAKESVWKIIWSGDNFLRM